MKLAAAAFALALAATGAAQAQTPSPPRVADAKPGEVRVMVTAAIRGPMDAVAAQAQRAIGKPVVLQYGSARGNLKNEILAGQDFEVAILLPDVDEELLAKGKVAPGTWEIARVPVAIGLRGEAANLDVSTPAALKAAMLGARSVKYAPTGAALMTVRKVLSTLDIADKIKDSSTLREPVALAPGEYEVNLYPLSEIIPNKALKNLGPVTPALQVPAVIEATIGKNARDPQAALALIKFLQGPAIDASLKENGMTKSTTTRTAAR